MFLTWIQDDMPNLQCKKAGEKLCEYAARGKRDLVLGYVEGLSEKYNFPQDRLVQLAIPADPRIFHPVTLTETERAQYACELAFMSNTSMDSERVVEEKIIPQVDVLGLSRELCMQIHEGLWALYRAGAVLTDRQEFQNWLISYPGFAELWWNRFTASQQADVIRLFYWRLNDTIYRHVVLEWADELGVDLHLHGQGWGHHPRFSKYAREPITHGPEINIAYQAAGRCLHLNIAQGFHQRIHEIAASGADLLLRSQYPRTPIPGEPPRELMVRLATAFRMQSGSGQDSGYGFDPFAPDICINPGDKAALSDWLFNLASFQVGEGVKKSGMNSSGELERNVLTMMGEVLESRIDWYVEDWPAHVFSSRQDFMDALKHP
jgi:hypothetical protein